ncbi:hypothetical protein P4N68_05005 [Corynebacterium felinum]|nr:hypothetical protein [Corynebacterium felinum]MDF5820438.1 hypothetical protein [Corynebacterium felinum]
MQLLGVELFRFHPVVNWQVVENAKKKLSGVFSAMLKKNAVG